MDTTGTFEMAISLAGQQAITCMHKHYSVSEWTDFGKANPSALPFVAASAGTSDADFEKMKEVLAAVPGVTMICLDVANGYSEHFVLAVRRYREQFSKHTIIAGNVVTCEMTEELILSGTSFYCVGKLPAGVSLTAVRGRRSVLYFLLNPLLLYFAT